MLAVWTLGVAGLAIRPPSPGLRKLADQPGFAACVAASLVIVVGGLLNVVSLCFGPNGSQTVASAYFYHFLMPVDGKATFAYGAEAGFAILAAWLTLLLGGGGRRAQLGRPVGKDPGNVVDHY